MAAGASILGDTGDCTPEHRIGGLAGDDLHAIAIVFSRTEEQCHRLRRVARQTPRTDRRCS